MESPGEKHCQHKRQGPGGQRERSPGRQGVKERMGGEGPWPVSKDTGFSSENPFEGFEHRTA